MEEFISAFQIVDNAFSNFYVLDKVSLLLLISLYLNNVF